MEEYMLLIRGNENPAESPEILQQRMSKYKIWMDDLKSKGQYLTGSPLTSADAALWMRNDTLHFDGPFMEAKEVVGGYILIKANSFEEAIELGKTCPLGGWHDIEIRKILTMHE